MRVFITGACGQIGTRVTHLFLDAGHDVTAFDVVPVPEDVSQLHPNLTYIKGDMRDYTQIYNSMKGCDAVVHLAASPGPTDFIVASHNLNIIGSYNALRAAVELGIKRIAQASSINAVGAYFSLKVYIEYLPIDENHPLYPDEGYGLSKQICEMQAESLCRRYPDIRIASIRPHYCIPDQTPNPAPILPTYQTTDWPTTVFEEVLPRDDITAHKELWGWNTYTSIANAFYLSIVSEGRGWDRGHEAFFIVSPRSGSERPTEELVDKWFPSIVKRGSLDGKVGLYDCSKANTLLGWEHDSPHDAERKYVTDNVVTSPEPVKHVTDNIITSPEPVTLATDNTITLPETVDHDVTETILPVPEPVKLATDNIITLPETVDHDVTDTIITVPETIAHVTNNIITTLPEPVTVTV